MANREYESKLIDEGFNIIAGTDEAGRGPLAGPLVVTACILPNNYSNNLINDSKQLSAKKREELYNEIINNALAYSIIEIPIEVIDEINIYQASKKGMIDAINALKIKPDAVITDAMKFSIEGIKVLDLIKGDAKSISVAAASILAKVYRDRLMEKLDLKYPQYDLKNNKGYGTKSHLLALEKYGYCEIHRKTYEPIKSMINKQLEFDLFK